MVSSPEMLDSVNVLILANRRVRTESISVQLEISASTAHKIVHDDFSKVSCHWVSQCKTSYCSKNSGNHQLFWLGKECHILLTVQFTPVKEFVWETKFSNNNKVKSIVMKWLKTLSKDFYAEKFVFEWEKYVWKNEDDTEK